MCDPGWTARPLLPLRDIVLFPGMIVPLFVGRPASIAAVGRARSDGGPLLLAVQRRVEDETPGRGDLFAVGVLAQVLQQMDLPDGTTKILVEPSRRAAVGDALSVEPCLTVECRPLDDVGAEASAHPSLAQSVVRAFKDYARSSRKISPDVVQSARSTASPGALADLVAAHLFVPVAAKQEMLEAVAVDRRLRLCLAAMGVEGGTPAPAP